MAKIKKFDRIDKHELRVLVAQLQIDNNRCSDKLAEYLVRIHDTVLAMQRPKLKAFTKDDIEEAVSYSLEVWIRRGLKGINLEKYDNPFSYIFSGTWLNILQRCQVLAKKRQQHHAYVDEFIKNLKQEFPGMQLADPTAQNTDDDFK